MANPLEHQGSSRLGTAQKVATNNSTSSASAAFAAQTYQLRAACDVDCTIKIGDGTPTAGSSDAYLPAKWPEYFTVTPGQKIAALNISAATGNLYVTECA